MKNYRIVAVVLAFVLALTGLGAIISSAHADNEIPSKSGETRPGEPYPETGGWIPCTEIPAHYEIIHHHAVTHEETITVVDEEAWTEVIPAVDGQHYSWKGGLRDASDPPMYPLTHPDWQPNTEQEPHNNASWVDEHLHYTGNDNRLASWFYYQAPKAEQVIEHPAVTHEETITVIDTPAWDEEIWVPDYTCDGDDQAGGKDPVTDPDEPKPAVGTPTTESQVFPPMCIGGALVTKVVDKKGNISSSTENGAAECASTPAQRKALRSVQEEGM